MDVYTTCETNSVELKDSSLRWVACINLRKLAVTDRCVRAEPMHATAMRVDSMSLHCM